MNSTHVRQNTANVKPLLGSAFREVQLIMAAPLTDEEIEDLLHQEPLNQAPQLPAEEEHYEQIESNR